MSPGLPRQTADRLIDELIMRSEELPRIRRQYAVVEGYEREGVRRRNIRTWAIFYREMLTLTSFESFTVEETSTN